MEQLKNIGDKLFNEQNYKEANKYYTQALEFDSKDKYKIYLNRCLSFYKQKRYDKALSDAIKATKLNPDNAKSWGRLGSCLNVLGRNSQSIRAFKKAYELEPTNKNYKKEIVENTESNDSDTEDECTCEGKYDKEITSLTKTLQSIDLLNNNMVDNILNNMLSNEELIKKISDTSFQTKILSYQNNPFEVLKDKETISLMCSMLKEFTKIKE
jgi:tetratricopeptide (TPR) repeat protein